MDALIMGQAVALLIVAGAIVLLGPFIIGKERSGKFTAWNYLSSLCLAAVFVMVAGRLFGWW